MHRRHEGADYTYTAAAKGAQADTPVEPDAQALLHSTVNEAMQLVLSRDLMLTNLAVTLSRAGTSNPLRGVRYMLNCVLKVVESDMAPLVRCHPPSVPSATSLLSVGHSTKDVPCSHYTDLQ